MCSAGEKLDGGNNALRSRLRNGFLMKILIMEFRELAPAYSYLSLKWMGNERRAKIAYLIMERVRKMSLQRVEHFGKKKVSFLLVDFSRQNSKI